MIFRRWCLILASLGIAALVRGADRSIPGPLANHPGNVFLQGEDVVVKVAPIATADWKLIDYDGHTVREGQSHGQSIDCGALSVGYYDLETGAIRTAIGVIAPLRAPTPWDSPIGSDTAASWFYKTDADWKAAANLAALAGMNWIRDRLSWRETELSRGEFVPHTKYDDTARIFHDAQLRILTVMHASPPWANPDFRRFPTDLRDASHFYHVWAGRLKGLVEAFEPWNEADWNHSGAEMASLQKACYLGIKSANPDAIVCQNVFATAYPNTVREFAANDVWPYFDTFNFHHYQSVEQYAELYGALRPISAGRLLWITEVGTKDISWTGDEKVQDPDEANLRLQAELVPKMFAAGLNQGAAEMFYFILGNYAEGQTQFGLLRRDLTPRPGYLALAAVGRLLAGAKPLGQIKDDQKNLRAFAFDSLPDGTKCDVIVAWATSGEANVNLGAMPVVVFDHLGREMRTQSKTLRIGRAPVFVVLRSNSARQLNLIPSPQPPRRLEGRPSPIVLQAAFPASQLAAPPLFAERVCAGSDQPIPLVAYNFSDHLAKGDLTVDRPAGWKVSLPNSSVELKPNERQAIAMTIEIPSKATTQPVRVTGDFGDDGKAIVSFAIAPTTQPAK